MHRMQVTAAKTDRNRQRQTIQDTKTSRKGTAGCRSRRQAQKPVEETAKKPQTAQAEAPKSAAPAQNNSARDRRDQEQSRATDDSTGDRTAQNNRDGRDNNRDNRGGEGRGRDIPRWRKKILQTAMETADRVGPNRDRNGQGRPQGEGRSQGAPG